MKQFSLFAKKEINTVQTRTGIRLLHKLGILLISFLLMMGQSARSQCTFASSFGTATINTGGTLVTISSCSFAGEYSTINGAVSGQTLNFTFTNLGSGAYITIHSGTPAGPIVASGTSPLSFANTFTGTLYAHWSLNAACGTDGSCHTSTVQCTSCAPAGIGCTNATSFGSAVAPTNATPVTISTCSFQQEYSTITSVVAGNRYTLTGSIAGTFITMHFNTPSGQIVAAGVSPLQFTASCSGTYYAHWNTNSACGTAASCMTTTIACTSCGAPASQCTNTSSFASVTAPTVLNTPLTITTCSFQSEYSTINSVVANRIYAVTGNIAGAFITIHQGSSGGPVVASGVTPLVFTATVAGTYYAHWNTNSACGTASSCMTTAITYTGDACVAPPPVCTIVRSSPAGTDNQTVCNSVPIANITYTTTVATGASFAGLPAGVNGSWASNVVTISGAPTANGVFNYTVTLTGGGCVGITATGTITVNAAPAAPTITPNPAAVCLGSSVALNATTGAGSVSNCLTSSGVIVVNVPDNTPAGAISTLSVSCVPAGATVTGVDVTINMTHTWDADMTINLQSPNSQVLNLINARGGSGDNFTNTVISSASVNPLSAGAPPFTGTFMADGNPANPPTAYPQTTATFPAMYTTPNGTWTLAMRDNATGDFGILTSWSITIYYTLPPAPVAVVWSPITELYSNVGATTPYIAGTPLATVYAKPTITRTYNAVIPSSPCPSLPASVVVTVNPNPTVSILMDPPGPLCQGDPKTLTVVNSPASGSCVTNSGPVNVAIPDSPSPGITNNMTVSCVPAGAVATSASVKFNITHTWDSDLNLFLKAPNGQSLNLVSAEGGSGDNFTNTIVSSTGVLTFASSAPPFTNTYIADANGGAAAPAGMAQTTATFGGLLTGPLNGVWTFGARDNAGADVGTLLDWEVTINYTFPPAPIPPGWTFLWSPSAGLNSTTTNPVAASPAVTTTYNVVVTDLNGCVGNASQLITVNTRPSITAQPANTTVCAGLSATFTANGAGTGATYLWQVSTTGAGGPWVDLANAAPYSGVTTTTLTINPVTFAMNGYRYRLSVSGACPPVAYSNGGILTVNALPVVTINPVGPICGGVAGINGVALTASGANTYTWAPANGLYTNATATTAYIAGSNANPVYAAPTAYTTYTVSGTQTSTGCVGTASVVVNYTPPAPTVTPSSVTMCLGDPAVKLKSSSSVATTVAFNSGTIAVNIPDNDQNGASHSIAVSGIPANATVTGMRVKMTIPHTFIGDLVIALKAPNNNVLNLDYFLSFSFGGVTTGFSNTYITSAAGAPALSSGTNPYSSQFRADGQIAATLNGPAAPTGYTANMASYAALIGSLTPANVNGNYTLAMYDGGAVDIGTLTNWEIEFTYVVGVPSTPAVWSPAAGLFSDALAGTPYVAGTAVDSVWTKPTPAGVYNYSVTVQSLPTPPVTISTPMAGGNGNNMVFFNLNNSNGVTYNLNAVSTNAFSGGVVPTVNLYIKNSAIAGNPGAINAGNGWVLSGTANNVTVAANTLNNVLTGLNIPIPAGQTYGIGLEFIGGIVPAYTNGTGTLQTYTNNGCSIITDGNVGWGGPVAPGPPANNPRNFNGSVALSAGNAPACTSPARIVTVTVNTQATVTVQPLAQTVCTDKVAVFSATATIPLGTIAYQWQVSTDGGNTYTNITNGGVYSGATTNTLTITNPPVSMSGYYYRLRLQGPAPCAPAYSFFRPLTVYPLPTVVITASPYTRLYPGLITTLSSTVSPYAAATYTWYRDGVIVSGATGATLSRDVDGQGDYYLKVTDVNGCTSTSNTISLRDSVSSSCFLYPNPSKGLFQVRYHSAASNVLARSVTVYNSNGTRVLTQYFTVVAPYARMDLDLRPYGKGVFWVEIGDHNGNRLTMCRALVQ